MEPAPGNQDYTHKAKGKFCPKCGKTLYHEHKGVEYPYVCVYCDENFYGIEAVDAPGRKNFLQKAIAKAALKHGN